MPAGLCRGFCPGSAAFDVAFGAGASPQYVTPRRNCRPPTDVRCSSRRGSSLRRRQATCSISTPRSPDASTGWATASRRPMLRQPRFRHGHDPLVIDDHSRISFALSKLVERGENRLLFLRDAVAHQAGPGARDRTGCPAGANAAETRPRSSAGASDSRKPVRAIEPAPAPDRHNAASGGSTALRPPRTLASAMSSLQPPAAHGQPLGAQRDCAGAAGSFNARRARLAAAAGCRGTG